MPEVFTPVPLIANQQRVGNQLLQRAQQGQQNISPLSPLANLLQGVSGGLRTSAAANALQNNQQIRSDTLSGLGGSGLAAQLLQSGDPKLQGVGVQLLADQEAQKNKPRRIIKDAGGVNRFVDDGSQVFSGVNPNAGRKPTAGFEFTDETKTTLRPIPGGPADPRVKAGKPATATERKVGNFATRMIQAEQKIRDIGPQVDSLFIQSSPAAAANFMRTKQGRKYRQAAMQFIRAQLRKESGAAISDTEAAEEFRTFFPVAGDDQQTILQKQAARFELINNTVREAGGGFSGASDLTRLQQQISPQTDVPALRPDNPVAPDRSSGARQPLPRLDVGQSTVVEGIKITKVR